MTDDLIQPQQGQEKTRKSAKKQGSSGNEPVPVGPNGESSGDVETAEGPEVNRVQFSQLSPAAQSGVRNPLDLIFDVQLEATVELGRCELPIRDILSLGPGSLVELNKLAGEPADLLVNGKHLARGEVVVIDENFGIRITEILTPAERIDSLR